MRLLFSAPAFKTSDYRAMAAEVSPELSDLEEVIFFGDDSWSELAATAPDHDGLAATLATLDRDDRINIQYTSGTTGFPKGATLTHHNILNNGFFVGELCSYTEHDRICVPVPFYHCFGMVMGNLAALTHGACVVVPAAGFDPAATLAAVDSERCTSLYGVPTMFIAMLADPSFADYDFASLRTGIMAGSPCPSEVMKRVVAEMNMTEVSICYGMTETSPVSTQTRKDDPLERRIGSIGRVGPHLEVKLIDPASGLCVPRGETGELCTRGYSVMLGYWDEPGEDRRRERRRRVDAHRRPRDDGRRGLPEHRRPLEGHGHPRRGERLSAGGRGVPLHPPRHRRRPGHRRPRREVRRGALRLDPAPRGCRAARPRGGPRVLRPASSRTTRSLATSGSSTSSR